MVATGSVYVRVRDCACPDTPHEGHGVWLRPTLSLEGGLAAEQDRIAAAEQFGTDGREWTEAEVAQVGQLISRRWMLTFVRYGVESWDLCDADGRELPFDVDVLLADYSLAKPIAEKANDLYGEAVLAPLRAAQNERSPTGQMASSTSPTPLRTSKRSRRSSRATSAGSRPSAA